ncbi:MAG: RNase adapter RapZ [Alphaproteobacteria bacterium]|nr:RNase adapter RapZ [Alphaproteobacteria bacterium]
MSSSPAASSDTDHLDVLLVTGMSGAGKTSALKALEDLGFEAIDNVPLSLLGTLVLPRHMRPDAEGFSQPIAIGVDIRTRDFGTDTFLKALERLRAEEEVNVRVLFLDCDDDLLRRRYAETRHRHPLALDRPVRDGIAHERRVLNPLRDLADIVIDSSELSLGGLKRALDGHCGHLRRRGLSVLVTSFAFRRGIPRQADLVFDVRFLTNPYYDPALRPLTGRSEAVAAYVAADVDFADFFENLCNLLEPLLPRYVAEGKSYLTIAVGCSGGQHRSVFIAEKLAAWLEKTGTTVHLNHRELDESKQP